MNTFFSLTKYFFVFSAPFKTAFKIYLCNAEISNLAYAIMQKKSEKKKKQLLAFFPLPPFFPQIPIIE